VPLNELHLEFLFKSGELSTDGGMIQPKAAGCGKHLAATRHSQENPNPVPIHIESAFLYNKSVILRLIFQSTWAK
jgi:hypothetical protein